MLVIGTALGSVAFPVTKTETTTRLSSVTLTQTETLTQSSNTTISSTPSNTKTLSSSSGTETINTCGSQIALNGTQYCSLDVTNITSIGVPGWATMNRSVDFMGVNFKTVCQDNAGNCGSQNETMFIGLVVFNLSFSDGSNENVTASATCAGSSYFLSKHQNPIAGFRLVCFQATSQVYLLVQGT